MLRGTQAPRDQQQQEAVTILRHEQKEAVFPVLERAGLMEAGLSGGLGVGRGMIGVVEEYVKNLDPEGTTALPLSRCLLEFCLVEPIWVLEDNGYSVSRGSRAQD